MSHPQQPSTKLGDHENNNGGFLDASQEQSNSTRTNSFVGKVRSTLSKWFNTPNNRNKVVVRSRSEMEVDDSSNNDSDDDSDYLNPQQQLKTVLPPAKRLKTTTSIEFVNVGANNNIQLRLFNQVGERNPKRLILNRRNNAAEPTQPPQDNVRESDSEESTSGYVSMSYVPQGNHREETEQTHGEVQEEDSVCGGVPSSSTMINMHNRSLFDTSHDRSLFTNMQSTGNIILGKSSDAARPASLSSRRPAFSGANLTNSANSSTTDNNSTGLLDRTAATRRIYNSPFYSGRTLYGGASNATIGRLGVCHQAGRRNNTALVVETDASSSTMLSSTARRILDTLECYTLDATQRKVANLQSTNKRQLKQDHLFRSNKPYNRTTSPNSQRRLDDLQVPNVAQLLKMKERLQNQTVQVRQMIKESSKQQRATSETVTSGGAGGKMRAKVTTQLRQRKPLHDVESLTEDNPAEVERLSAIQLPISALPKFIDLQLPLPKIAATVLITNSIGNTVTTTAAAATVHCTHIVTFDSKVTAAVMPSFDFTPTTVTSSATIKPVTAKDNEDKRQDDHMFVFAKPLVLLDGRLNGSKLRNITAINNFKFSVPPNQKLIHKLNIQHKAADSVSSANTKPTTAPCSENTSNIPSLPSAGTFGNSFKLATTSGQWECDVCLIRNPSAALTCLACTSPKQSSVTIAKATSGAVATTTSSAGWGGTSFKPSSGSGRSNKWNCDVCLVSNGNDRTSCAACETPKPGTTVNVSAAATSWECPSCMVRNQSAVQKCVCCETLKPGSNIGITKLAFGVAAPAAAAATTTAATSTTSVAGGGFTFGIPPSSKQQQQQQQTISGGISTTSTVPIVTTAATTAPTGFTFGIPAATMANGGSGGNSSSAVSSTTTLNQKPLPNGMISSSSASVAPSAVTRTTVAPANVTESSAAGIKFGAPTTTTSTTTATVASSVFAFGRPAVVVTSATTAPVDAAATTAIGQHVSSSTSATNGGTKAEGSPLETKRSTSSGFSSSGVSSTAAKTTSQTFAFTFNSKEQAAAPPVSEPQVPVFSFGSSSRAATVTSNNSNTSNSSASNGPFLFGGAPPEVTATVASVATVAPSGLFTFGSSATNATSSFAFGGAAAPQASVAPMSFGGGAALTNNSNMFGVQPAKMKNGGFDFSAGASMGGSSAGKTFQRVQQQGNVSAAGSSAGGFNFTPQNAAGGALFSFGSTAAAGRSASGVGGNAVPTAAAPFTFGAVSSSSSSAGNSANKPVGAPLSFGGITSSSTPSLPPPPHANMFGTPTPSIGALAADNGGGGGGGGGAGVGGVGSQIHQQRRIIRKAVRRTNTQQPR